MKSRKLKNIYRKQIYRKRQTSRMKYKGGMGAIWDGSKYVPNNQFQGSITRKYDLAQATWLNILDPTGMYTTELKMANRIIPIPLHHPFVVAFQALPTRNQYVVLEAMKEETDGRDLKDLYEKSDKGHLSIIGYVKELYELLKSLKPELPSSISIVDKQFIDETAGGSGSPPMYKIDLEYDDYGNNPTAKLKVGKLTPYQRDFDNVVNVYYADLMMGNERPGMNALYALKQKMTADIFARDALAKTDLKVGSVRTGSPIPEQPDRQRLRRTSGFGALQYQTSSSSSDEEQQYDKQDDGSADFKEQ
jgi:hypothetical protein